MRHCSVLIVLAGLLPAAQSFAEPQTEEESNTTADEHSLVLGEPPLRSDPAQRASDHSGKTSASDALDPFTRAGHTAMALGPGAVVHGAGHYAAGKTKAGDRLLLTQGIGAGLIVVGLGGLAATGASRYVTGPLAVMTASGAGLFLWSWWADIYGVTRPPEGELAPRSEPRSVSELGYRYVYDPQFRYRHFLFQRLDLSLEPFRLSGEGWFAADDENALARAEVAYRFFGPTPNRSLVDQSALELEAAYTLHRYDSDGFRIQTGELSAYGRLDLAHLARSLRRSFVGLGVGLGLSSTEYRIAGIDVPSDFSDLLLLRMDYGFSFGKVPTGGGDFMIYYDHRHDGYAAGLKLTGLGSGVAGHIGVQGRYFFHENFGLRVAAEVGSAWVLGTSLLFRVPGRF